MLLNQPYCFRDLGTDHLSNQNDDNMFMAQTEGVLTDKRQDEMSEESRPFDIHRPGEYCRINYIPLICISI